MVQISIISRDTAYLCKQQKVISITPSFHIKIVLYLKHYQHEHYSATQIYMKITLISIRPYLLKNPLKTKTVKNKITLLAARDWPLANTAVAP